MKTIVNIPISIKITIDYDYRQGVSIKFIDQLTH